MSSFVNLLANDVWSEADIKARLHAEFRTDISEFMETEINRALNAMYLKMRLLSAAEQAVIAKFAAVDIRVAALGIAARADMALLNEVLAHEAAMSRLSAPVVEDSELDMVERDEASAVAASASQDVVDLYSLRNPVTVGDSNEVGTV